MNLSITSKAKNKQISFLIALDRFISRKNSNKPSIIKGLKQFVKNRNPEFNIRIKEANNSIEMYTENNLIAYYA